MNEDAAGCLIWVMGFLIGCFIMIVLVNHFGINDELTCKELREDWGYPVVYVEDDELGCMWKENGKLYPILLSPVRDLGE